MSEAVVIEHRQDGVSTVRINRPPLNFLDDATFTHLETRSTSLSGEPTHAVSFSSARGIVPSRRTRNDKGWLRAKSSRSCDR